MTGDVFGVGALELGGLFGQILVHQTFGLVLLGHQRGLELAAALDQRGQPAEASSTP